jgi:cytochrome c-type biogenesis protein CcmH/NrfG
LNTEPGDVSARYLLAQELAKSERVDDALVEFSRVVRGGA